MNTNRVFPKTARQFGLVSIVESTRVVLPLKGVECEFAVQASVVEVTVTQVFRQENPRPLDCDYLFPLPADASVYFCEADINGRIISAKARERKEAVRLATEKKAEGRRVLLVEPERENLFTLTLNNLQPEDFIIVKIKYIQPLRCLANAPSIEIPFCPGVRYIAGNPLIRGNRGRGTVDDTDQVPDASRISPVRIDKNHPDAAFIEIRGTLDAGSVDPATLVSPSHNIISRSENDHASIRLSDGGEVPDRDFVLRWRERSNILVESRAFICEREGGHFALVEIRAPKAIPAKTLPMDFYFLVDRSGSMAGIKWEKAVEAVQSFVKGLGQDDRVMITFFSAAFNDFTEEPLSPSLLMADNNFQNLARLSVGGGTEMHPAFQHVIELSAVHSEQRDKTAILITDAQIGNEARIKKLMESAPGFTMHCLGLDNSLNDSFLIALVRQQNGTFHSMNPGDDIAGIVTDLTQTIRHPVLRNLEISKGWETSAGAIPPLYSGQTYYLSARKQGDADLELTASDGDSGRTIIACGKKTTSGQGPYLHWCKSRIQRFVAEKCQAEAIALSIKSNLICPLTAFIAWDEVEKVAIAEHALAQPVFISRHQRLYCRLQFQEEPERLPTPPVSPSTYRAGAAGFLSEERIAMNSYRKPDDLDTTIVDKILAHARNSDGLAGQTPLNIQERLEAFREIFIHISELSFHPEWMGSFEAILSWVSRDQAAAILRSNLVAEFVSAMVEKLRGLRAWRNALINYLEFLQKTYGRQDKNIALHLEGLKAGHLVHRELEATLERLKNANNLNGLDREVLGALSGLTKQENEIIGCLVKFPMEHSISDQ